MTFCSTPSRKRPQSVPPALPQCEPLATDTRSRPRPPRLLGCVFPDPPQGASDYFSLVGVNHPALRLDRPLDFYERPNMAFRLLVRVSGSPQP